MLLFHEDKDCKSIIHVCVIICKMFSCYLEVMGGCQYRVTIEKGMYLEELRGSRRKVVYLRMLHRVQSGRAQNSSMQLFLRYMQMNLFSKLLAASRLRWLNMGKSRFSGTAEYVQ